MKRRSWWRFILRQLRHCQQKEKQEKTNITRKIKVKQEGLQLQDGLENEKEMLRKRVTNLYESLIYCDKHWEE